MWKRFDQWIDRGLDRRVSGWRETILCAPLMAVQFVLFLCCAIVGHLFGEEGE